MSRRRAMFMNGQEDDEEMKRNTILTDRQTERHSLTDSSSCVKSENAVELC